MHAVLCLPISAYISLCLPQAGAQYQCMPPAVGAPCPDGTLAVATADLPEMYTGALDFQRYIALCLPYVPLYLPYISLYLTISHYISLYLTISAGDVHGRARLPAVRVVAYLGSSRIAPSPTPNLNPQPQLATATLTRYTSPSASVLSPSVGPSGGGFSVAVQGSNLQAPP